MPQLPFLTEFLLILVIATFVAVTFERFRLPSILGLLLAGVIIGPGGLGLISETERVHQLADVGIILLMLTIGLEFSFDRLKGVKNIAFFGGALQILLSIGICLLFAWWRGLGFHEGFFLGSVIALSSTAIVLKYLIDRGELGTPYGRIAVSILIFQDLAVVPLMIVISGFASEGTSVWTSLGFSLFKAAILLASLVIFARYFLKHFMHWIALTRNREILFLASVAVCLGTAWLSGMLGLSLALGAFFAGLMLANTDFGHQLIGEITPFRYIFVSFFFVSVGLLFDFHFTAANFSFILLMVGLVLVVNFALMTLLLICFRVTPRVAMATGIILSQIGEFSFLLIELGRDSQGITPHLYQVLISTAFLTMLITPFLFALVPHILKFSEQVPALGLPITQWRPDVHEVPRLAHHVILCGYGPSGRDLAMTFKDEKIPFVLLEMNPALVKEAKKNGMHVIYGDATNVAVLRRAGIKHARAVVVSFPDPIGMGQIIRIVQSLNSNVLLAVRTRYENDVARLYELGADIVVMEEWEASHEMNRLLLEEFEIHPDRIQYHLDRIRMRKELTIEEAILKRPPKGKTSGF